MNTADTPITKAELEAATRLVWEPDLDGGFVTSVRDDEHGESLLSELDSHGIGAYYCMETYRVWAYCPVL